MTTVTHSAVSPLPTLVPPAPLEPHDERALHDSGGDRDLLHVAKLVASVLEVRSVTIGCRRSASPVAWLGLTPEIADFAQHLAPRLGDQPQTIVLADVRTDAELSGHEAVTAGAPLAFACILPVFAEGKPVGFLFLGDGKIRNGLSSEEEAKLADFAAIIGSMISLKEDANQRALNEVALSRDERRHAMALEAANVGSWLWDVRTGTISCNLAMARMFGMEPAASYHARDFFTAIHRDDRARMLENLRHAMAGAADYDSTIRVASTGRWLLGRGRVHERDAKGRPTVFLGVNIDVTSEQTSSQRTRLLLRELNHRVKNTLAMLQSLARQTLRQTSDPQQFMTAFAGRLQAISEAHGLLSDHEWGAIRLSALLEKQLAPHVRDYQAQVEIHKDEILLGPDQAVGLGLVLHELATNAAKYGALSVPKGRIVFTARGVPEEGGRVLHLTWTEVGGPLVQEPQRRGFGSILIERSLDKVMGSSVKVEYLPDGVTAIIRLPL
ncbi:histidine kinase [Xaviernesmea oryzae]|uniref:Blue-light-activated histidine kinase n=1 Tax=Xaviernesmea oryzae TaxID=464029 RepID=A0A1Q9B2U7_9HYPH|nr:HWE histidine kinase domain-containing protein [Xaviernesmea oryzae]OLP62313.1 histidine kinase [Xaviernesmea oryzae]SEL96479.1 PAS domain S-box-containing protein [Xaviernesmea oryzae]